MAHRTENYHSARTHIFRDGESDRYHDAFELFNPLQRCPMFSNQFPPEQVSEIVDYIIYNFG